MIAKKALFAAILCLLGFPAVSRAEEDTITVVSARYGWNIPGHSLDVTNDIAGRCNHNSACDYTVDVFRLTDPSIGNPKAYSVDYRCGARPPKTESLTPEANGHTVSLRCP
jgi:hypothetical protein